MYKTEVIRHVALQTRLSQKVVAAVVQATHAAITDALRQGKAVQFPGFGTFYTRRRSAGAIRSVRTKQLVQVPAMPVAGFRVGDVLKRAVRTGGTQGRKRTLLGAVLRRQA